MTLPGSTTKKTLLIWVFESNNMKYLFFVVMVVGECILGSLRAISKTMGHSVIAVKQSPQKNLKLQPLTLCSKGTPGP